MLQVPLREILMGLLVSVLILVFGMCLSKSMILREFRSH